jgi:hypothetical protein
MRTTIDIHDELLARAKRFASSSNKRLAEVVNDALQEALNRIESQVTTQSPYRLETYGSGGVRPGIDLSDNGSVQDALDESGRESGSGRMDFNSLR